MSNSAGSICSKLIDEHKVMTNRHRRVLILEPDLFGDARGYFFELLPAAFRGGCGGRGISCRTTNRNRARRNPGTSFQYGDAAQAISWCAWSRARCSTSRWTSRRGSPTLTPRRRGARAKITIVVHPHDSPTDSPCWFDRPCSSTSRHSTTPPRAGRHRVGRPRARDRLADSGGAILLSEKDRHRQRWPKRENCLVTETMNMNVNWAPTDGWAAK